MPIKKKTTKKKVVKKSTTKKKKAINGLSNYHKSIYGSKKVKDAKKKIADAEKQYKQAVRATTADYKRRVKKIASKY